MSNTAPTMYTDLVTGAVEATGDRTTGWLKRCFDPRPFVKNAMSAGGGTTVQVPIPSAFTVGTVSLGTPVSTAYNNTFASLTYRDRNVPIAVTPSQRNQWDFSKPENVEAVAYMSADALMKDAAATTVANLIALTPGKTSALATGKIDFAAAGATEVGVLASVVSYIEAHAGGKPVWLVFEPVAWGGFQTAIAGLGGAITYRENNFGHGIPMWNGYECYTTGATSTSWGGASNACCFVMTTNAYAFATTNVYPHFDGGFWSPQFDGGFYHIDNITTLQGKLTQGLIGEITNPGS